METRTRRQSVLLAVLVVTLAGVLFWNLSGDPAPVATTKKVTPNPAGSARRAQAAPDAPPDVALDALQAPRPEPGDAERNPFRFKPKAPPPPPPNERASGPQ